MKTLANEFPALIEYYKGRIKRIEENMEEMDKKGWYNFYYIKQGELQEAKHALKTLLHYRVKE